MARKEYMGEFAVPEAIETAAKAFYDAIKESGYDSASVDVCPELESFNIRLATFLDNGVASVNAERADGRWKRVEWVDDDD